MNENTTTAVAKPMRFGRALHMDLSRASDEALEAAFRVLDDYDTAGKASAYTEELIDERIAAIFDEQDRREGQTPVFIERQPGLRDQHLLGLRQRIEAAGSIGEEDDRAEEALGEADADVESPTQAERDLAEALVNDPQTGGLVPGETSAI
jgi:hypothetical protein